MSRIVCVLAFIAAGCGSEMVVEGPVTTYAPVQSALGADPGGQADCSLVRCLTVDCPEGFRRHFTPHHCCGICIPDNRKPEGKCSQAEQCEGLLHPTCVGTWSCDGGWCAWTCEPDPEPLNCTTKGIQN